MELSRRIDRCIEDGIGNITELEQEVIQQNDAQGAYLLAKNFQHVNVQALQDVVIKSEYPAYAYWFARFVKGAKIKSIHEAIVKSGHLNYNYHFGKFMKGSSSSAKAFKDYEFAVTVLP